MDGPITIKDVTPANIDDLCRLCVPAAKRGDPSFRTGMAEKARWSHGMVGRWGGFAKLAYVHSVSAGQIQYEPLPGHGVVRILCIYVPAKEYWRAGVATALLDSLIDDMRRPQPWFEGRPARALVTKTFPAEQPGQLSARAFFRQRGFRQVGDDPDFLYFPLTGDVSVDPATGQGIGEDLVWPAQAAVYVPQPEDRGRVVIIHAPSFCPWSFPLLRRAEALIAATAPELPVRWISAVDEPGEVERRGGFTGCIVNATSIRAFVGDKAGFQNAVRAALGRTEPR